MKKSLLSLLLLSFSGTILAQSWDVQNTGFTTASRGINQIEIVDANTVWAIAYDGVTPTNVVQEFTKTTNGGSLWTPGTINVGNTALQFTNLSAISATTAWIGAFNPNTGIGGTWKTIDGGATWNKQNPTKYATSGQSWFNGVHFFDANNGVTVGDPLAGEFEIYITSDGGANWTSPNPANIPDPEAAGEYGYGGSIAFAGNSFWFATSEGNLYRTTDMGATWSKFSTPLPDFGGYSTPTASGKVYFSDNNNGVILGTRNTGSSYILYTTTDGGANWDSGTAYAGGYNRALAYVPNTLTIYATGINATAPSVAGSSYSTDNGVTFTNIDSGTQRGFVSFLDANTGWCAGFNTDSTTGGIFKFNPTLGVNDFKTNKQIIVTPNPSTGIIQLTGAKIKEVNVYDLLGKRVYNSKFNALNEVSINLSSLQTGTYVLKATNELGAIQTMKILKN
ncbi:MAG: T9SS type A sorting domain-containing protein [Bacteroidota bacterium]